MPAKDDILAGPINIAALRTKGTSNASLVDSLWTNFMSYASKNWSYIASSTAGGADLLSGASDSAPCGGIAKALKTLIEDELQQTVNYITISGYVWTKPEFLCFDPKVKGNVSRAESPTLYTEGCLFNEHYFLECNGKFYDPCLNSRYDNQNDSVKKSYNITEIISKGVVMAGTDPSNILVFNPNVVVAGWQRGAWVIVQTKDLMKFVTDKYDLMYISTKMKTGKVAEAARAESKKLFTQAGRLDAWKSAHASAGIRV